MSSGRYLKKSSHNDGHLQSAGVVGQAVWWRRVEQGGYMKCLNLHHAGLWVDDLEEMAAFLTDVLGFRLLTHGKSDTREWMFFHAGDSQTLEVLRQPEQLPRPDIPHHMEDEGKGAVVGIPHLAFRVTDLPAWEDKIRALNYTIYRKSSGKAGTGYFEWALGVTRVLWFIGPSGIDIELLEFEEEFPFSDLPK